MKTYIGKPFEALQLNRHNIVEISSILPESFVFYGINEEGGKEFGDPNELALYSKVGGYYYHNKSMRKIFDGDWIIVRKGEFEFINDEYFSKNFIEINFNFFF